MVEKLTNIFCFILAIVKYNFLNVVPIALHKVVDIISDVYVVFNEENEIVDYNRAFAATWTGVCRKAGIRQVLGQNCPGVDAGAFDSMLRRALRRETGLPRRITATILMSCWSRRSSESR